MGSLYIRKVFDMSLREQEVKVGNKRDTAKWECVLGNIHEM